MLGRNLAEDYPLGQELSALHQLKVLLEWRLPRQVETPLKFDNINFKKFCSTQFFYSLLSGSEVVVVAVVVVVEVVVVVVVVEVVVVMVVVVVEVAVVMVVVGVVAVVGESRVVLSELQIV